VRRELAVQRTALRAVNAEYLPGLFADMAPEQVSMTREQGVRLQS